MQEQVLHPFLSKTWPFSQEISQLTSLHDGFLVVVGSSMQEQVLHPFLSKTWPFSQKIAQLKSLHDGFLVVVGSGHR
jgi:hypothetical protein